MLNEMDFNRRQLFEALGAGVLFQFTLRAQTLGARLHFADDGTVTLLTGKVDIGQGSRTLLTQCVAEELQIDPAKVRLIMGDTALVPDDGGTFASLTTPMTVPVVRQAAAAARKLLRTMKPAEAMLAQLPVNVDLIAPAAWKILGKPLNNVNGRAMVTGSLHYSSDIKVPGMLAGNAVRSDEHQAELVSFDAAAAEKIAGVKVIRDGNFLGVTAPDERTASKATALVRAEWKAKDLGDAREVFETFKKTSTPPVANFKVRYPPLFEKGSISEGLANAATKLESSYTLPFLSHVPIEPRSAIAIWDDKGLTVHSGSQVPFGVRKQLAEAFSISEQKVRVIVPATGSGFGSKHGPEVALEAARLSKAAGKPVRVAWTRAEEFQAGYFRPAALVEVRSGLDAAGRITVWDFHNYNSGPSSLAVPYAIPHHWCGFHRSPSPLRQGPYRSLAAVANTFAREMHVSELAAISKQDPVEFRLRNLENPRMKEVIERAAATFGWGKNKGAVGMSCNLEKDAHIALFTEIEANKSGARVRRMTIAFDCGAVLNPQGLRNQIEGALIMGIGGALFEEVLYDRRAVRNKSLNDYRVPRFADAPEIQVILADRRDVTPAGAGESPITVAAPAIGAAIHAATGKWMRSLPMRT